MSYQDRDIAVLVGEIKKASEDFREGDARTSGEIAELRNEFRKDMLACAVHASRTGRRAACA